MKKRVYLAVTNDLTTEQRVNNIAESLLKQEYEVVVIGIKNREIKKKDYKIKRFFMIFKTGKLFYMEYSVKLFFYLLFSKVDIIVANDLDTLVPCFLASKFKKKSLVYDSHELFTEVPELSSSKKKFVKRLWLKIEKRILPKLKYTYTVCDSIANEYNKKYGCNFQTVRNLPSKVNENISCDVEIINLREKYPNRKIVLYQGALNENRGVDYMIKATQYVDDILFVIVGKGYMKESLIELVDTLKLTKRILFIDHVPYENLHLYTKQADLGISLEEYTSKSYYFSLTNKFFNYISNGVPVFIAKLPEMEKIVKKYDIGVVSESYHPLVLGTKLNEIFDNRAILERYKKNTIEASKELNWENEESKLFEIYDKIV